MPGTESETEAEPEVVPEAEEWILEHVEAETRRAPGRRPSRRNADRADASPRRVDTSDVRFGDDVAPQRADRLRERLAEAAHAFARDRHGDAVGILRPIAQEAPGVAEVRELLGLAYYRQGRWNDAARELRAFNEISGSTEQHPVLADCARALGNHGRVEAYWRALRNAAPDADLVAEGRIVMAGSLADQDRLDEAVALLTEAIPDPDVPAERDARTLYALADLYERAGDLPAARSGFARLDAHWPDYADVAARLDTLS